MLKHHLITALRSLVRYKGSSAVNVLGLSIGMAAAALVIHYVLFETSYDSFQPNLESTYRMSQVALDVEASAADSIALGRGIQIARARAEIEDLFALYPLFNSDDSQLLRANGNDFRLSRHYAATANIADFVSMRVVEGDLSRTLALQDHIAINRSQALRIFGTTNSVGRRIDLVGNRSGNAPASWTVGAIFDDLPANTHFDFDSLSSAARFTDGENNIAFAYVRLRQGIDPRTLAYALDAEINVNAFYPTKIAFHPLRGLHLATGGRQIIVNVCIALSAILIAIAALNFVNISTAQSGARAREVGVRKALGASRTRLIIQFLSESIAVACISALISACLMQLALPWFNQLINRDLAFDWIGESALILSALAIGIGVFAGLYPAMVLASFGARRALSGDLHRGETGVVVRKGLFVLQIAACAALILGSTVLYQQVRFLESLPTGYAKTGILEIGGIESRSMFARDHASLIDSLRRIPGVQGVTLFDRSLTEGPGGVIDIYAPRDPSTPITSGFTGSGFDVARTLGMELLAGRDFSPEFATDWYRADSVERRQASIIITESMARRAGYANPNDAIGQPFRLAIYGIDNLDFRVPVVGVVADVKIGSVRTDQRPISFICGFSWSRTAKVGLRLANTNLANVRDEASRLIGNHFGIAIQSADARLIEDQYAAVYDRERNETRLVGVFSVLAIALCCVGTFGLAAFSAQQRRREFAVRRVHGASSMHLMNLLEGEYLRLALLSTVLAFPVSYVAVARWLSQFSERISISVATFLLAAAVLCATTWLTVSAIALRAARLNPADVLRYE
jgi:putative ABC transport system permease protein